MWHLLSAVTSVCPSRDGRRISQLQIGMRCTTDFLQRPELCTRGFKPMLFDRQLEHAAGDPKILSRPPFAFDGKITVRYSERLNVKGTILLEKKLIKTVKKCSQKSQKFWKTLQ